jgi:DivIVA domain-containing protein
MTLPVSPLTSEEAAAMSGTSRFPRTRWGTPGYHAADVDELVARIEATLSGSAPDGQAVTAGDIRATPLRVTRRGGYDDRSVDDALDRWAEGLTRRARRIGR